MRFKAEWVENKSNDWKVATVQEMVEGGRSYENCSINRKDKNGLEFPGFDQIAPGYEFEADYWRSQANKNYLFAPKVKSAPKSTAGMKAAQDRKAEHIERAQENKNHSIKVAAAMRDSTLLTIEILRGDNETPWQTVFSEVRSWYFKEWNKAEKENDVPFN